MDDPLKQVIVIRGDLNMPAGKLGSQTAHATQYVFQSLLQTDLHTAEIHLTQHQEFLDWLRSPKHTKICLRVNSEAELLAIYNRARDMGLLCGLVEDAGLTVFQGARTMTCCAIGPARASVLHPLTGNLPLY